MGSVAGLLAGLLGVGGGLIIVPMLLWLFQWQGLESPYLMQLAVGTSLASIVFTSLASVYAHHQHRAVLWPQVFSLTPGILAGALLGALLADQLASARLTTLFALFELLVAVQMFWGMSTTQQQRHLSRTAVHLAGLLIGAFSALIGIGGGTLTVPFLSAINTPIRHAVATSAACGLPIALAGSIGFVVIGWGKNLPESSWGYLYPPALLGIVLCSVLFAPLGARLAHRLPTRVLKRFFAGFLLVLGLGLLWF
ncbi:MAG: sulfite exporter TauE/SafE family protein [Gammaproteobacteria bacterium]|nr:sulfite exporter TauE/SafE family protein [Gammaproteobacteria bacterium]